MQAFLFVKSFQESALFKGVGPNVTKFWCVILKCCFSPSQSPRYKQFCTAPMEHTRKFPLFVSLFKIDDYFLALQFPRLISGWYSSWGFLSKWHKRQPLLTLLSSKEKNADQLDRDKRGFRWKRQYSADIKTTKEHRMSHSWITETEGKDESWGFFSPS